MMSDSAVTLWTPPETVQRDPHPGWATRWLGVADLRGLQTAATRLLARGDVDQAGLRALGARYRAPWPQVGKAVDAAAARVADALTPEDFERGAPERLRAFCAAAGSAGTALSQALLARGRVLYADAVSAAIADGEVTKEEAAALKAAAATLALPEAEAAGLYGAAVNARFNDHLAGLLEDGMLSPDEDAELADLFTRLNVNATFDDKTVALLNDARRSWAIANAPLPPIAAPVALQRNEVAYAVMQAECYEQRTRTRSVSYGGPAVRVKIAKGLYYRAGNYRVGRETEDYQHLVGTGPLVVTSKRLIFAGDRKALSPRLDSILQIEAYVDGLAITRSSGKPLLFTFRGEDPWFAAILQRARADA